MSKTVEMMVSVADDDIWLLCRPITKQPPKDRPEIVEATTRYLSCRLFVPNSNSESWLSDWFSIPRPNIHICFKSANEPVLLNISKMSEEERKKLFSNTEPVFSVATESSLPDSYTNG